MDKDLLQTVAFDFGVSQYSSETEYQFHNRVIYTALACWIKAACQDQPVMQSNVCEGVSRRHIHDKCSKVLSSFLCRYSSSVPWFTTDDSSEDAVSLIRSRLLRHQDIINVGFNTNVALAKCNNELLSNTLEVVRGALFIPQCHYNGISLTRTPTKPENAPQHELMCSSTWLSEYLSSAWWEPFVQNAEDHIEYFDATKKAANMYQCWQTMKPKAAGKYIIARRPVNVSSHEYLVVNTQNSKLHRIDSVLQDFGEHRRLMFGLTGTPSSNGLMDLWAQFRLLDMGKRLGRFITHFRNNYFQPDKRNGQVVFSYKPLPGAENAIYRQISDITISMKAVDHLTMPECVINEVKVALSKKEKKAYDTMKAEMVLSLGGEEIDAGNATALANKLSQMANGAVYSEDRHYVELHNHKLDALEDLIEAANGKPVLVAYWFKHDLERIQKRFTVREISTSKDIADWNAGKIPVAVIHPASAGHGLNLQAGGSTFVWFGLTWSLELYQQANARLWRQGQTADTVVIHHIIAANTIDEQIMSALRKKEKTQSALIDAVKANLEV